MPRILLHCDGRDNTFSGIQSSIHPWLHANAKSTEEFHCLLFSPLPCWAIIGVCLKPRFVGTCHMLQSKAGTLQVILNSWFLTAWTESLYESCFACGHPILAVFVQSSEYAQNRYSRTAENTWQIAPILIFNWESCAWSVHARTGRWVDGWTWLQTAIQDPGTASKPTRLNRGACTTQGIRYQASGIALCAQMWQDCVILIELDNSFDIFDILFGSTVQPTTKSNAFKLSFDGKGSLSNWGQNTTVPAALGRAKTGQNGLKRQVESGKFSQKLFKV